MAGQVVTLGQEHARHRLCEPLLHPVRFSIAAALVSVDEAEFGMVRDAVEVSDSVLSKQVSALARPGLVKVRKGYVGVRPRTWVRLSDKGRQAYHRHVEALREIAGS